jgi:CRP/FNR family transcriptional regulator
LFYDLDVYKEIARKNSRVYDILTQNICHYAMMYYSKFISLSLKQVNGRIAETLLYLYKDIYNVNPIVLSISKHDIADMTGMSKDTATRVLKSFHEEGIIEMNGNNISIVDEEKLVQISLNG